MTLRYNWPHPRNPFQSGLTLFNIVDLTINAASANLMDVALHWIFLQYFLKLSLYFSNFFSENGFVGSKDDELVPGSRLTFTLKIYFCGVGNSVAFLFLSSLEVFWWCEVFNILTCSWELSWFEKTKLNMTRSKTFWRAIWQSSNYAL